MKINFDSIKPVYMQIAEAIEDDIISGKLIEGAAAYSQLVIAKELNVNPATAAKGINVLVSKGILEKGSVNYCMKKQRQKKPKAKKRVYRKKMFKRI